MKLRIVALGHRMPAWVSAGFDEYARRLPREFAPELVELRPEPRARGQSPERILAAEARRIVAATRGFSVIALDEHGEHWSTAQLAARLSTRSSRGQATAFVIGSADGLAPAIRRGADATLALSALTLPHGLVRIVLAEQLYRAASLLHGHPYHRQ